MDIADWVSKPNIPLTLGDINGIELDNEFGQFRVGTKSSLKSFSAPAPIQTGNIRIELQKYIGKYSWFQYGECWN